MPKTLQTRHAALLGAVAFAALAPSMAASAQTLGPLVRVTQGSIFGRCTADDVAGQEKKLKATNYLAAAVEPQLAVNPLYPTQLLFGVQEDRWSDGGSRGQRGDYSFDGGVTWKPSSTTGVTLCQNGPWQRSSDPWIAFSADGTTAYFSALTVDESANPNALAALSGQTVNTSRDGGKTWAPPSTLILDNNINVLNDKNSVWADAALPKLAYVVWDRLQQFNGSNAGVADEGGNSGDAGAAAVLFPQGVPHDGNSVAHALMNYARAVRAGTAKPVKFPLLVKGPTEFSRTTDQGNTWSVPTISHDPGRNAQTIANQIVTLPQGQIANFFTELNDNTNGQPARIGYVESSDHGLHWSAANYAQEIVNQAAKTPNLQEGIRSADVLYSIAVDTKNNITYLVWEDERFSGDNEVAFSFSPDNGFEWTAPVRINQTPRNPAGPLFQQALIPTVAVAANGTVGVTYYDFRNDKAGAKTDLADYWAVTCNPLTSPDNCLSNGDWSSESRLTDTSFDFDLAPNAGAGHFLGDYMGLKTVGQDFLAVFGQSPAKNITSQYFRRLTVAK